MFRRASLHSIFNPKTVVVIGPTQRSGSLGHKTLSALLSSPFGGAVFAVQPEPANVLGVKTYPTISAVPAQVDLAVVAVPRETIPEIVAECAEARVKGTVVISGGLGEHRWDNAALEQRITEKLSGSRMRLVGPGCTGVINPSGGLNASPGLQMPLGGSVAFLSQSAAIGNAILGGVSNRLWASARLYPLAPCWMWVGAT
jgi:acetyltransferase